MSLTRVISFCLGMMMVTAGWAGQQEFVLRDHLNRQWTRELVGFPFEAKSGECKDALIALSGPDGPMAAQLTKIERWAGTDWVKSATVVFVTDLGPLETATYTLYYGEDAASKPKPVTDLRVAQRDDELEIATSRLSARFPVGERQFGEPAAAADVPGPMLAFRMSDGPWFGGARLFGPTKLKSLSARLLSSGPVVAEVGINYEYADGNTVSLTGEVVAGDSSVTWSTDVKMHRPQDGWDLIIGQPGSAGATGASRGLVIDPRTRGLGPQGFPPRLCLRVQMEYGTQRREFLESKAKVGDVTELLLGARPAGVVTNLTPWPDWYDDQTQATISLPYGDGRDELQLGSRRAGDWVEPVPQGLVRESPTLQEKRIPLIKDDDGSVVLRVNAASGKRHFVVSAVSPQTRALRQEADRSSRVGPTGTFEVEQSSVVGRRLNEVKDYALEWPQNLRIRHPFLYLSQEQLVAAQGRDIDRRVLDSLRTAIDAPLSTSAITNSKALGGYLLVGDRRTARAFRLSERLAFGLQSLGHFDKMRDSQSLIALYDALIDSDLIAAKERPILQAQLAYLGYSLADPYTWSAPRGYCSGNLNMTVAYVLNLGLVACVIPDHPKASAWVQPALEMMDAWLSGLGAEGEHPESVANYASVSVYDMLGFAIAARNAGLRDYVSDPRMMKLLLYLAKQYTPPDPRYGYSKLPPAGRGAVGSRTVLAGLMARATREIDSAYSAVQQWVWQQEGFPYAMEGRMGGYEYVFPDPRLPAVRPDWITDLFPDYGVIFRKGVGTKDAYYLNFQVHMVDGYPSMNGSFPVIFAKGKPISTFFSESYRDREELLISRVLPARRRGNPEERRASYFHEQQQQITDFSCFARQDYAATNIIMKAPRSATHLGDAGRGLTADELSIVRMPEWPPVPVVGSTPVVWRRQVLFIKDDEAGGEHYFLLRDTTRGGQPTIWQFWTLSEQLIAAGRAPREPASRGRSPFGLPPQSYDRLDRSRRSASEQVATSYGSQPAEARELSGDRFTAIGQFGVNVEFYVASPQGTPRHTLRAGEVYEGKSTYQDLLHLQLTGDGAYFVALFPSRAGEPVPEFNTLGAGKIVRVAGTFGTDYCFLSETESSAAGDGVAFKGTAGSVQLRKSGTVLALAAKGTVATRDYTLAASHAACLRLGEAELLIDVPPGHDGSPIVLKVPGSLEVAQRSPGIALNRVADDCWSLTLPSEYRFARLKHFHPPADEDGQPEE